MTYISGFSFIVAAVSAFFVFLPIKNPWPGLIFSVAGLHLLATMTDPIARGIGRVGLVAAWAVVILFALLDSPPTDRPRRQAASGGVAWLICFVCFSGLSIFWSGHPMSSLMKWLPLTLTLIGLVTLALKRWSWNPSSLVQDMNVLTMTIALFLGISYLFSVVGLSAGFVQGGRYQGIFQNPNTIGLMCVVALASRIGLPLSSSRLMSIGTVGLLLSGLALSGSRTSLFALLFVFGIHFFRVAKRFALSVKIVLGLLLVGCIALTWALLAPGAFDAAMTKAEDQVRLSGESNTPLGLSGREDIWERGYQAFLEEPLVGHGLNESRYAIGVDSLWVDGSEGELKQAHNSYLEVLIDLGVVGGLLLGVPVLMALLRSYRFLSGVTWLSYPLWAIMLMSLTESIFFGISSIVAVLFWLFVVVFICTVPRWGDAIARWPRAAQGGLGDRAERDALGMR